MSDTTEHLTEENAARTDGKPPRRHRLLLTGIVLLGAVLTVQLFRNGVLWFNMPSRKTYPVRGVDASHYQGQMDWPTIASQGITFAFLKATEGSGTVDDCFAENWENARAAGLSVGAYHFFSFDSAAETQADNYCAVVPECDDALPPVIDLEFYRSDNLPEPEEVRRNLRILLERMRSTYGKKPIIYTTRSCWSRYLADTDLDYTLWIRSIYTEPSNSYVPDWTFWQYNPRGMLDGYTGGEVLIDLNIFRGTEADFRKFAESQTGS
ncbi:MAG: glycoside hydrolase family 25 [Oscillospiraceae bacterium]|nr:glycoside hydrolase family 25 [Oscillospiraceae bacterium]